MTIKVTEYQAVIGMVVLILSLPMGCAKSRTSLGSEKDAGEEPEDAGADSNESDNQAVFPSETDSGSNDVARTGRAGSTAVGAQAGSGEGTTGVVSGSGGFDLGSAGGATPMPVDSGFDASWAAGSGGSVSAGLPGSQVLNPQACTTDRPFVLSIDPGGSSGYVDGWLESSAVVSFEGELPRFDSGAEQGDLRIQWSIGSAGPDIIGTAYFYGNYDATVAYAEGIENVQEIHDATALLYDGETREVMPGAIIVFHHVPTNRYLALRLDSVYSGDEVHDLCAAISASWVFAPQGSADFSQSSFGR